LSECVKSREVEKTMSTHSHADAPGFAPDAERRTLNPVQLNRLRWRCRRGMLENDLILARFLDAHGARMTDDEAAALIRLLDLADGELWDLLSGRNEPDDSALRPLVADLRAV
jgi:antitoxin CptB